MTNKKLRIVCAVLTAMLVFSITTSLHVMTKNRQLAEENTWYEYQYVHAYNACEAVAEYGDSTADTGEFDEFLCSENGHFFWDEWNKVNENQ